MTRLPIEYGTTDITGMELVRPLWIQLNDHHHINARVFKDIYRQWTFDDRKAYFVKVAEAGSLRVDLAFDPASGRYVGYCVSSLSQDKEGEIESIYVEETYRSQGIDTALVNRALAWLGTNSSIRNRVSVADGNEESFRFYRKFGFHPRLTVLEQKND